MKPKGHSKHPVSCVGERITNADRKDAQTEPYTYKQRLYSQKQSCSNGSSTLKYQSEVPAIQDLSFQIWQLVFCRKGL